MWRGREMTLTSRSERACRRCPWRRVHQLDWVRQRSLAVKSVPITSPVKILPCGTRLTGILVTLEHELSNAGVGIPELDSAVLGATQHPSIVVSESDAQHEVLPTGSVHVSSSCLLLGRD